MSAIAGMETQYIDRLDVVETFIDSTGLVTFDGNTVRAELCVTRMNEPAPPKGLTGRKYPAVRLVLTPNATVDLFNHLQTMIDAMEKQGLVKRHQPAPVSVQ
jgi:hypothetical protein